MATNEMACHARIEQKITATLKMQSGFPASAVQLWAKVLTAALETLLAAPNAESEEPMRSASELQAHPSEDSVIRLQGVVEFSRFLLAKGDEDSTPNEYALEALVSEWNLAHNDGAKLPSVHSHAQVCD